MVAISDPIIQKALAFIDSLRQDENRSSYYEIIEPDPNEHKVFPQSQYLLYITFKQLGLNELANRIARAHDFTQIDKVDPNRAGRPANDSYSVLEGDLKPFRLAGNKSSDYNDERALLSIYWTQRRVPILGNRPYRKNVERLAEELVTRYDPARGVLEMDAADSRRKLYAVFKVALFGIMARRTQNSASLASVQNKLIGWQHKDGGWETDRTTDLSPQGYANLETTCLAILALLDK